MWSKLSVYLNYLFILNKILVTTDYNTTIVISTPEQLDIAPLNMILYVCVCAHRYIYILYIYFSHTHTHYIHIHTHTYMETVEFRKLRHTDDMIPQYTLLIHWGKSEQAIVPLIVRLKEELYWIHFCLKVFLEWWKRISKINML